MTMMYRPRLHFSPRSGWMNDPNGLLFVDGLYHLFFQHDPDSIEHGPMHWGHAISRDLVEWRELPVALYPGELGTCYSGSAVEDEAGEISLFYTAHRLTKDGADFQTQCMVRTNRDLTRFDHHNDNPVIDNPGLVAFRDPKVFWHAPTSRWVMVVTHGRSIGIYSSGDLIDWKFESEFGQEHWRETDVVWECPDLIALPDAHGKTHWVLLVSIYSGAYGSGSGTFYFLGNFDGARFSAVEGKHDRLWLDFGRDCYAAQSFFDRSNDHATIMAWVSNWNYARQTPTEEFRGVMSLPRNLTLRVTSQGLRLHQTLSSTVQAHFNQSPDESGTFCRKITLDLSYGQATEITLFGEDVPHFRVTKSFTGSVVIHTARQRIDGLPDFSHAYDIEFTPAQNGPVELDLYVDQGVVELVANDGLVWVTNLFFPENPAGTISINMVRHMPASMHSENINRAKCIA